MNLPVRGAFARGTKRTAQRPLLRRLSHYTTRSFRGADPNALLPPDALPAYKPPSLLEEHRLVVVGFAILVLALAAYWIKSLHDAVPPPPPAPKSVYVEMLPSPQATPAR